MHTKKSVQASTKDSFLKAYFSITDIVLLLLFLLIFISLVIVAVKYDVVSTGEFVAAKKNYVTVNETAQTSGESSITTRPYIQQESLTQAMTVAAREVTYAQ